MVAGVEKINEYLGTGCSPELCQQIADACRFEKMKPPKDALATDKLKSTFINEETPFYRKGEDRGRPKKRAKQPNIKFPLLLWTIKVRVWGYFRDNETFIKVSWASLYVLLEAIKLEWIKNVIVLLLVECLDISVDKFEHNFSTLSIGGYLSGGTIATLLPHAGIFEEQPFMGTTHL